MRPCPRCQRGNPDEAVYCGGCGVPLEPEKAAPQPRSDAGQTRLAEPEELARPAAPPRERAVKPVDQPRRTAVAVVALLGLAALVAATGHKVVTRPGREVPAVDPRLRALPPPTGEEEEPPPPTPPARNVDGDGSDTKAAGSRAGTADGKPADKKAADKKTADKKTADRKTADRKTVSKKPPDRKVAKKAVPKASPKKAAAAAPKKAALGGPPDQSEIEACINTRKAKVRACADEAAQRMEPSGWGIAQATLNPNGTFSDIRINGGEYFVGCARKVLGGLRCRAFQGEPVEVRYRLR